VWEKSLPKKRTEGSFLGMDMGYKKLISCSDGTTYCGNITEIYNNISRKKQGSKAFNKALTHRDNEINRIINSIDLKEVKTLFIEDLKDLKKGKKYFTNKIQRWSYVKTISKLNNICDEHGIIVVKVSPQYTSQTCSSCGDINKESRNKENFLCISCGYDIDADINASINILNRGVYSLSN
jgi:putative transposase